MDKPGNLVDASVYERIEAVVRQVPAGRVATYGQVGRIARAASPRQVGYAMATLAPGTTVPWHRVLNSRGMVSARGGGGGEARQRALLAAEGVVFDARGRVDLGRYAWDGPDWAWLWESGLARS